MKGVSIATAASKIVQPKLSRESRCPRHTPQNPGSTKISRRRQETPCPGHSDKQCTQGAQQARKLAQSVPRETAPTTNPAVHAQQMTRKTLETESQSRRDCAGSRKRSVTAILDATEQPIRNRLAGSASPALAAHGRHPLHNAKCRRVARPSTSPRPCQMPRFVSARSPSTTSRSSSASSPAAASTHHQPTIGMGS